LQNSGVARKIFLLRQSLTTCIGRKVFGRDRVRGHCILGGSRGMFPQAQGASYFVAFLQNLFIS